jgi:hypothetical protein
VESCSDTSPRPVERALWAVKIAKFKLCDGKNYSLPLKM